MKKKIFILLTMVAVLACLFAISVSAASTETIDGITYYLHDNGTARLTNANQNCGLETVIIPETVVGANGKTYTVTEIQAQAFQNNKTIKYVSIPATMYRIYAAAFNGCSNLVFVEFNEDLTKSASLITEDWGIFASCTSLIAVSLPDRMTKIPDRGFNNCTALTAVYLPANLYQIKGNQGNNQAAFYNSANLYFVQEPFNVRDGNGNFYTAETFTMPSKPDVYFFPETLKLLCGTHNINGNIKLDENGEIVGIDENGNITEGGYDDIGINKCTGLNSVLVLPEGFTGYDEISDTCNENLRGDMLTRGLIQNCGTKDNPLTIVFLGRIDRVTFDKKDGCTQYLTYVFANEANTGFDDTVVSTFRNTKSDFGNQNEIYVVFCHANNGLGAKYSIKFEKSAADTTVPVLVSTLQEGAATHIANPKCTPYDCEPDCIKDRMTGVVDCFCGNIYSYETIEAGTALGHNYDVENGAIDFGIVYTNYMEKGIHSIGCARCDYKGSQEVDAIFVDCGYSVTEEPINGKHSMIQCYKRNQEAYDKYVALRDSFEFGVVVSIVADPLNPENSDLVESKQTYIAKQSFIAHDYFDVGVSGISENQTGVSLVFCAYVIDNGEYYYLDGGETVRVATAKSHADLAPKAE